MSVSMALPPASGTKGRSPEAVVRGVGEDKEGQVGQLWGEQRVGGVGDLGREDTGQEGGDVREARKHWLPLSRAWLQETQPSCFPRCFLQISGLPTAPSCCPLSPPLPSCPAPRGSSASLLRPGQWPWEEPGGGWWEIWPSWGHTSRQGASAQASGESRARPTDNAGDSSLWGQWSPGKQSFLLKGVCVGEGRAGVPSGVGAVLGKGVLRAERWVPGEGLCGRQVEVTVALAGRGVKHGSVWVHSSLFLGRSGDWATVIRRVGLGSGAVFYQEPAGVPNLGCSVKVITVSWVRVSVGGQGQRLFLVGGQ